MHNPTTTSHPIGSDASDFLFLLQEEGKHPILLQNKQYRRHDLLGTRASRLCGAPIPGGEMGVERMQLLRKVHPFSQVFSKPHPDVKEQK
ncbi:hypothetical protein AMECASPLE_000121 [Ameca splendens]|uniref:Uncharacterized protein n=1 Tax=Ameca splendens TaxID=208324 RepID=A0ABV0YVW8_9TELE